MCGRQRFGSSCCGLSQRRRVPLYAARGANTDGLPARGHNDISKWKHELQVKPPKLLERVCNAPGCHSKACRSLFHTEEKLLKKHKITSCLFWDSRKSTPIFLGPLKSSSSDQKMLFFHVFFHFSPPFFFLRAGRASHSRDVHQPNQNFGVCKVNLATLRSQTCVWTCSKHFLTSRMDTRSGTQNILHISYLHTPHLFVPELFSHHWSPSM